VRPVLVIRASGRRTIVILEFLFRGVRGPVSSCLDAADVDDDGTVEVIDPILLVAYLFLGFQPPPDPGPLECGVDPTESDRLGECVDDTRCR